MMLARDGLGASTLILSTSVKAKSIAEPSFRFRYRKGLRKSCFKLW